jgi:ABC-type amino acid transport system permease subunit
MMRMIILPQALKLVIPGIVNTFIGLFKDTTLVLIIGLFDFSARSSRPFGPDLVVARAVAVRLFLRSNYLLDLLFRHVALLHVHGTQARYRAQTIRKPEYV